MIKHLRFFVTSFVLFGLFVVNANSSTPTTAQTSSSIKITTQQTPPPPATQEITKSSKKKNKNPVASEIGLNIPEWGIAIDATFNPELDGLIPGYHILNIVLTNRRAEAISLNPTADKWVIVDRNNRKHTAFNHVTQFDRKLWEKLPPKLQKLLDYPMSVSAGKSVKIDVFLNETISLHNFKEIAWRSDMFEKTFSFYTTYEETITTPSDKEFEVGTSEPVINADAALEEPANDDTEDTPVDTRIPSKYDTQDSQTSGYFDQPQEQTIVIH